jgi:hypothetical protein
MKLINNQHTTLIGELKDIIRPVSEVFITASYASIPALFELNGELEKSKGVKFIVDSEVVNDSRFAYDPKEFKSYFTLIAKHKAIVAYMLVQHKFQIRQGNIGGQKFILVKNPDKIYCFSLEPQDINTLTLGSEPSPSAIILKAFEDEKGEFLNLFDQYWHNSPKDLKEQVLQKIKSAFEFKSPEFLYKFTLYHLFKNTAINEENERRINKIGFKHTEIWNMLFNFQKDAAF